MWTSLNVDNASKIMDISYMWTSLNVDNTCEIMDIMCTEYTFSEYIRI